MWRIEAIVVMIVAVFAGKAWGQEKDPYLLISSGAAEVDERIVDNEGIRLLLLDDRLDEKKFREKYAGLPNEGRIRLLYVAARTNPKHFPIRGVEEVARDGGAAKDESFLARILHARMMLSVDNQSGMLDPPEMVIPGISKETEERLRRMTKVADARPLLFRTKEERVRRAEKVLQWIKDLTAAQTEMLKYVVKSEVDTRCELMDLIDKAVTSESVAKRKAAWVYYSAEDSGRALAFARLHVFEACQSGWWLPIYRIFKKYGTNSDADFLEGMTGRVPERAEQWMSRAAREIRDREEEAILRERQRELVEKLKKNRSP